VTLGCYGLVVNLIRWDFGKLLGVYVAIFALVSVLWGQFIFKEAVALSTKVGVTIIIVGGLVISWSEVVLESPAARGGNPAQCLGRHDARSPKGIHFGRRHTGRRRPSRKRKEEELKTRPDRKERTNLEAE
jgi:hypothetical protein